MKEKRNRHEKKNWKKKDELKKKVEDGRWEKETKKEEDKTESI